MKIATLLFSQGGHAKVWPTLFAVFVTAGLVSIRVRNGFLVYESGAILAAVVPIAGTIVALALPAAQLAQSVMESFLSNGTELVKSNRPLGDVARFLANKAQERRRDLAAMKCVVLYGLASLLVGLCGTFGLFAQTQLADFFAVRDFIASLAAMLLIASVLWFIPVVRTSFNFDRAEGFARVLGEAARREVLQAAAHATEGSAAKADTENGPSAEHGKARS